MTSIPNFHQNLAMSQPMIYTVTSFWQSQLRRSPFRIAAAFEARKISIQNFTKNLAIMNRLANDIQVFAEARPRHRPRRWNECYLPTVRADEFDACQSEGDAHLTEWRAVQPANFSTRTERKVLQLHGTTTNRVRTPACVVQLMPLRGSYAKSTIHHKIFHSHTAEFDRELRAIEFWQTCGTNLNTQQCFSTDHCNRQKSSSPSNHNTSLS